MKRKLLLTMFTLLCGYVNFAQKKCNCCTKSNFCDSEIKTVYIDFEQLCRGTISSAKKTIKLPRKIKEGEFYRVVVNGINLNLYSVSLTASDTVLSKPQKTPTFGDVSMDELLKTVAGISTGNSFTHKGYAKDSLVLVGDSIAVNLHSHDSIINSRRMVTFEIRKKIDSLKLKVYVRELESQKDYPKTCNEDFDYDKALLELYNIRKDIDSSRQQNINLYKEFKDKFKNGNYTDDQKEIIKSLDTAYAALIKNSEELVESVSADKTRELLSGLIYIDNNKSRAYVSLPQQFMGEQGRVYINIKPRNEKIIGNTYSTRLIFPSKIRSYTSVGISFYGTTRHDETYDMIKTPVTDSTATYRIEYGDYEKTEIGISALLRYGSKFTQDSKFGAHGTIGAGMSISQKVKPRLMLGLGISYGTKHMISVDGGIIAGFYDKINTKMIGVEVNEKPTDVTYSILAFGPFLSVGYLYQF